MDYKGFRNYETWLMFAWLNNSEASYKHFAALTRTAAVDQLADAIKSHYQDNNPLAGQASVYNDIITNTLGAVDWREIARQCIQDEGGAAE